jgi:Xaa-Pro aminopeptidase
VVVTGKPSANLEKIHQVAVEAQQKAIAAIRPGASLKAVDAIARDHIAASGFGPYFGHGLGHGFGLQIHESPRLSPLAKDNLEVGMVVTVEPGIYLPNDCGVRIEDDVLVTVDGCEVLSNLPRSLQDNRVEFS